MARNTRNPSTEVRPEPEFDLDGGYCQPQPTEADIEAYYDTACTCLPEIQAAKSKTPRAKKVATINGVTYYATRNGIKAGSRGRVQELAYALHAFSKGESRKLRKALRSAGFPALAATPKAALPF